MVVVVRRVATMKKRRLLIVGIEVEVILGDLRVPPLFESLPD